MSALSSSFPRLLNGLLIALAVVNCIIVLIFETQRRPRVERIESTVITNHVIVVTNYITSAASSYTPSVSSNVLQEIVSPRFSVTFPYRYMVWDSRRYACVDGREYLTIGSPTSYGRISEIFPDRILLDNGVWLNNVRASSLSLDNTHPALPDQHIPKVSQRLKGTSE